MSQSTAPLPVNPGDPGRGPMIAAVTWVFTVLAAISVGLWITTRHRMSMAWGAELWLMVIAVLVRIAFQITITISLAHGLGKHDADLTPEQLILILKYNWIALPGAIVTSVLARISITILLIHLFGIYKWFKYFLISLTTFQVIIGIIFIPLTFVQVKPVQALWDIMIQPTSTMDPRVFLYSGYFVQSFYTFSDLTYALFPVIIIWRLHKPLRARIGLMLLMCVSLFTMAASILKTYYVAVISNPGADATDLQYTASWQVVWGVLEQDFVIIMGCIPSIRILAVEQAHRLYSATTSLLRSGRTKSSFTGSSDAAPDRHKTSETDQDLENNSETRVQRTEKDGSHINVATGHRSDEESNPSMSKNKNLNSINSTTFRYIEEAYP